ncbi:hypothetical protein CEXT_425631 [Caerostris extrusa]|uniref:Uncharacterized protein n=1 Tax=Caerostris extrusa TaxID=172846 RepID=A0AAV4XXT7_CAEEX|nr:hypothetical protein CEXT_425631 [Caerostris extrusa]
MVPARDAHRGSTRGTHFLAKTARPRFHRYQPISNTETLSATPQPRYIDSLAELDVSNNNETISIHQTCNYYTAFESGPSEAGFGVLKLMIKIQSIHAMF